MLRTLDFRERTRMGAFCVPRRQRGRTRRWPGEIEAGLKEADKLMAKQSGSSNRRPSDPERRRRLPSRRGCPADIVTSSDPHVIREQNAKRLLDLADAGDIDAIVNRPSPKVTEIELHPATDRVGGMKARGGMMSRSILTPRAGYPYRRCAGGG